MRHAVKALYLATALTASHAVSDEEFSKNRLLQLTVNTGVYPVEKSHPLGRPFEIFNTGWESRRVSAELGNVWEHVPPALRVEIRHFFSPGSRLYLDLALRREISAWYADPLGGNWPLSADEVALNQPNAGYFQAENTWASITLGRFAVHWSPSSEYGLALSRAVPHHNGVLFSVFSDKFHFHFLASSLNSWLEGTPIGDSSGINYPIGSEEWKQRNYPGNLNENAHLRVYDEPVKTLIAHRLTWEEKNFELGLTEISVIGGKVPDFRDLNPLGLYHNDFKDGYANTAVSMDVKFRFPLGFSLLGEGLIDDVRYRDTEAGSSPSAFGWLGGLEHSWSGHRFKITQSAHFIQTDPLLYRYLQPYNTMSSRIILTSNNQRGNRSPFVDKYVLDYPLGYARGGDAMDFRYALHGVTGRTEVALRLDYLTHGGASLEVPYEDLVRESANTNPFKTEEWRALITGGIHIRPRLKLLAGAGFQNLLFPSRTARGPYRHAQAGLGLEWKRP